MSRMSLVPGCLSRRLILLGRLPKPPGDSIDDRQRPGRAPQAYHLKTPRLPGHVKILPATANRGTGDAVHRHSCRIPASVETRAGDLGISCDRS